MLGRKRDAIRDAIASNEIMLEQAQADLACCTCSRPSLRSSSA